MEAVINNLQKQSDIINMLIANAPFIGPGDQRAALEAVKIHKASLERVQRLVDRINDRQICEQFQDVKALLLRYERSLVLRHAVKYDVNTIFDYMQAQLTGPGMRCAIPA